MVDLINNQNKFMEKKFKYFIGIDISKLSLDVSIMIDGKIQFHSCISNTKKAIKQLLNKLYKNYDLVLDQSIFCMEFTGIYGNNIINYLSKENAQMWLEAGTHMKRSLGMVRGKNDELDSKRIADFAYRNTHKIKLYKAPRTALKELKVLLGERKRYMKCKKQITCAVNEQNQFLDKGLIKKSFARTMLLVDELVEQIAIIEADINTLIKEDKELKRLYKIVTSVDGVGLLTAVELIVTSEEFKKISDPKKYGCYCGVVPFDHQSGTSVRGKSRVSNMANKQVKTTLHMAALSAIRMKGDLRDYYLRKVADGKNKMLVINAIRNKMVLRIFACVRENRVFQK